MNKQEKAINALEKAWKDVVSLLKKEPKVYDYTDIKDFDDAYSIAEDSQTKIGDMLIEEYSKIKAVFPEGSYYDYLAKLRIIVFAVNGCNESFPDWKDDNQQKRYPWFYMDKQGVGFSFFDSLYDCTATCAGSRLVFKDIPRCEFVAKHKIFGQYYKVVFNQ